MSPGTWNGKGTEVWNSRSTLLQVLVSIQGLILVSEPYYNEPGNERQKGSRIGSENARMYNEMAVLKLTRHMAKLARELLQRLREGGDDGNYIWRNKLTQHFKHSGPKLVQRLEKYLTDSEGDVVADALVDGAHDGAYVDLFFTVLICPCFSLALRPYGLLLIFVAHLHLSPQKIWNKRRNRLRRRATDNRRNLKRTFRYFPFPPGLSLLSNLRCQSLTNL